MVNEELEEQECPFCGEYLKLNKSGVLRRKNTTEIIYIFTCEECNQAFALDNDEKMKVIHYDSNMKLIQNKCKICRKIENYNEKGLFLLNIDTGYYEFYCFKCAKPILQEWLNKNAKKKTKVTDKNIHEIYDIYDFNKNNEMLQEMKVNPEKYKDIMNKFEKKLNQEAK